MASAATVEVRFVEFTPDQIEELRALLENSASNPSLDCAACSAEALLAAWSFVAGFGVFYGNGLVRVTRPGWKLRRMLRARALERIEVRRFAVELDAWRFASARAALAAGVPKPAAGRGTFAVAVV